MTHQKRILTITMLINAVGVMTLQAEVLQLAPKTIVVIDKNDPDKTETSEGPVGLTKDRYMLVRFPKMEIADNYQLLYSRLEYRPVGAGGKVHCYVVTGTWSDQTTWNKFDGQFHYAASSSYPAIALDGTLRKHRDDFTGIMLRADSDRIVVVSGNVILRVWYFKHGDSNGDGKVTDLDLLFWNMDKYGKKIPARWSEGDFNLDGFFDYKDIILAAKNHQ